MKSITNFLLLIAVAAGGAGLASPQAGYAHCQIPCGIYDDYAQVLSMREDVATIAKATKMIGELAAKSDSQSQNQLVRWVMNKDKHAQNIIETISNYFLTQRVKPDQKDYAKRLQRHHAVILAAMKAKQHAGGDYVKILHESIEGLVGYYPEHTH